MARPTRIALVTPNYHPRTCGVGDYAMRVGTILRARGYDASIVTHAPASPHPDAPELPAHAAGPDTHVRMGVGLAAHLLANPPEHAWLQYTPQMFHASRLGSPLLPTLAAALRARGVHVTVVAHELYLPVLPRPDLALGAVTTRAQALALLAAADSFVVTTENRVNALRALAPVDALRARISMAPVGANAAPLPRQPATGGFHVGTFSTVTAGKRVDLLLDAFTTLRARVPDAELWIIGDPGDPASRPVRQFNDSLAAHPWRDAIHVTGRLPLPDVAARIAALHAFAFAADVGATTRSGTLPTALGTGLPVVAFRGRETGSWFRDGENVLLAPDHTSEALGAALARVAEDRALAQRLGAGARRLYEDELQWPRIVDRLLAASGLA